MGEAALRRLDDLFEAIGRQSVTIAGSEYVEELIKQEASFLLTVPASRKKVAESRDELLSQMPEARLLMSLPGLGAVTCATFLAEVGDISRFPNASKLASYAGLAPKVRQSGKTIHSVTKPRGGTDASRGSWSCRRANPSNSARSPEPITRGRDPRGIVTVPA